MRTFDHNFIAVICDIYKLINRKPSSSGEIVDRPVTQIDETTASLSMGVWPLLATLFSVLGLRRSKIKK